VYVGIDPLAYIEYHLIFNCGYVNNQLIAGGVNKHGYVIPLENGV
jgi:hypothetical protein